jgi:MFS family permease
VELSLIVSSILKEPLYSVFVIVCFILSSFYAGKYSRKPRITTSTAIVSLLSFGIIAQFFPVGTTDLSSLLSVGIAVFFLAGFTGFMSFVFEDNYPGLWEKRIERKYLTGFVKLVGVSVLAGFGIWVLTLNMEIIMRFLDTHPWVATLIIGVLTFLGGIALGKKRKTRED